MGVASLKVVSVGDYIREQREHAQVSLRQLAKTAGVSNPYLSQIERGLKKPSAEILQQIAKGLRISAETLYVRAGILEDRGTTSDVVGAVLADPTIDDRQKRVLLDIYESFRNEHRASLASRTAVRLRRRSHNQSVGRECRSQEADCGEHDRNEDHHQEEQVMSVTKTITTSKPFYVVAGAGDLAVKTLREGTDKLSTLRIERKDIETTFSYPAERDQGSAGQGADRCRHPRG